MKVKCCFLFIILNVCFLHAENDLQESILESHDNEKAFTLNESAGPEEFTINLKIPNDDQKDINNTDIEKKIANEEEGNSLKNLENTFHRQANLGNEIADSKIDLGESQLSKSSENLVNSNENSQEITLLEPNAFSSQLNSNTIVTPNDLKIPAPKFDLPIKNASLVLGLSHLVPGLGHVYLGEYKKAGLIFGSSAISLAALLNKNTRAVGTCTLNAATGYSLYSAYRDVRLRNNNYGYTYKMPQDSFKQIALAPFNLKILKKKEVWGGLLGAFIAGVGIGYIENKLNIKKAPLNISASISAMDASPLRAFTVGIIEETLFRGYLQPVLSEKLTPIGGIIMSSLIFGAAHIPNAQLLPESDRKNYYFFSLPFITSMGSYLGWLSYKNNSLQESIALHSWYDFTLFALERSLTRSAAIGMPNIAFSFSF